MYGGLEYNEKLFFKVMGVNSDVNANFRKLDNQITSLLSAIPPDYKDTNKARILCDEVKETKRFFKDFGAVLRQTHTNFSVIGLKKSDGKSFFEKDWVVDLGNSKFENDLAWYKGVSSLKNGEGFGDLFDAAKMSLATKGVIIESAEKGKFRLFEFVVDLGIAYASVKTYVPAKFADLLLGNNYADTMLNASLDVIRVDASGKMMDKFNNTKLGEWLTEHSSLKPGGAGAEAITGGSEKTGKLIIAIALEVASYGTATPFVCAALRGGEELNDYTQSVDRENGEAYDYFKAYRKTKAGLILGYFEGKMLQGVSKVGNGDFGYFMKKIKPFRKYTPGDTTTSPETITEGLEKDYFTTLEKDFAELLDSDDLKSGIKRFARKHPEAVGGVFSGIAMNGSGTTTQIEHLAEN